MLVKLKLCTGDRRENWFRLDSETLQIDLIAEWRFWCWTIAWQAWNFFHYFELFSLQKMNCCYFHWCNNLVQRISNQIYFTSSKNRFKLCILRSTKPVAFMTTRISHPAAPASHCQTQARNSVPICHSEIAEAIHSPPLMSYWREMVNKFQSTSMAHQNANWNNILIFWCPWSQQQT